MMQKTTRPHLSFCVSRARETQAIAQKPGSSTFPIQLVLAFRGLLSHPLNSGAPMTLHDASSRAGLAFKAWPSSWLERGHSVPAAATTAFPAAPKLCGESSLLRHRVSSGALASSTRCARPALVPIQKASPGTSTGVITGQRRTALRAEPLRPR